MGESKIVNIEESYSYWRASADQKNNINYLEIKSKHGDTKYIKGYELWNKSEASK